MKCNENNEQVMILCQMYMVWCVLINTGGDHTFQNQGRDSYNYCVDISIGFFFISDAAAVLNIFAISTSAFEKWVEPTFFIV